LTQQGLKASGLEADSLQDLAAIEPEGVYTIIRTFQGDRTVLLEAHFDRLEESARLEGLELTLDRVRLRQGLRALIHQAGFKESRLRITIPQAHPEIMLLAAEPLPPFPLELKQKGVSAATVSLERTNPRAKSNTWEQQRAEAAQALPSNVYEGLLLSPEGSILEGFSSNFYGQLSGKIHTAAEGILHGISRRILLDVLPAELGPVALPVRLDQVPDLTEAFITSSSRGVVPVVTIDDQPVGRGRPGATSGELARLYDEWVKNHLEKI
jgi:branched-chain amino acid aminotransferase